MTFRIFFARLHSFGMDHRSAQQQVEQAAFPSVCREWTLYNWITKFAAAATVTNSNPNSVRPVTSPAISFPLPDVDDDEVALVEYTLTDFISNCTSRGIPKSIRVVRSLRAYLRSYSHETHVSVGVVGRVQDVTRVARIAARQSCATCRGEYR